MRQLLSRNIIDVSLDSEFWFVITFNSNGKVYDSFLKKYIVLPGILVVGALVGATVGAAVEEKFQSQVPDSSPTAAIPNLFSLITLALSSVAEPEITP